MKRFTILIVAIVVLAPSFLRAQFYRSVDDTGVLPWEDVTSWEYSLDSVDWSLAVPAYPDTLELAEPLTIQSYIDRDGPLSMLGFGNILTVGTYQGLIGDLPAPDALSSYDIFVVRGDLNLDKASANIPNGFTINTNGIVIVFGDLTWDKNNAIFSNDGILVVTGSISVQGSQNDYINGESGLVFMNGTIDGTEYLFGDVSNFDALLDADPIYGSPNDIDGELCNILPALQSDPREPLFAELCDFITTLGDNPLPVELTRFTAAADGGAVEIAWSTASEVNNDFFLVQRSYDALNYQTIGTVEGKGTVVEAQNYTFMDGNALPGTVYYRLVQTDYDGATETFGPVVVQLGLPSEALHVYPNPLDRGVLTIQFAGLESDRTASLQIADLTGKTVFTDEVMVSRQGAGRVDLELPQQLRRGAYIVNLAQGGKRYSEKLIKIQ